MSTTMKRKGPAEAATSPSHGPIPKTLGDEEMNVSTNSIESTKPASGRIRRVNDATMREAVRLFINASPDHQREALRILREDAALRGAHS